MRSRSIAGLLVLLGIALAASRTTAAPAIKWAIVNLKDTTVVAGRFMSGPVVFVHDDAKMARGEPCTSVHEFDAQKGIGKEIVAFHCKPRWTKAPARFTQATSTRPDGPVVLTEYQFAGDEEAHGVPTRAH
jgi:hypothetical protein